MVLAQLLQRLEGKFRELADLEQRVLAADKAEVVPLRTQFIELLFGPRFFGDDGFFRMYAGTKRYTGPVVLQDYLAIEQHIDIARYHDLIQAVKDREQHLYHNNGAYGETEAYQAIALPGSFHVIAMQNQGAGKTDAKETVCYTGSKDWLLLRLKQSSHVRLYSYKAGGIYCATDRDLGDGIIIRGSDRPGRSEDLPLVITPFSSDDIVRVDGGERLVDSFTSFYAGLVCATNYLIRLYEGSFADKSFKHNELRGQASSLEPQLELMRALAGNRQ